MRIKHLVFILATLTCICASAQTKDIRKELADNPLRYGGSSAPYLFEEQNYQKAPSGYVPFYISHFGRHGSRYHSTESLCPSVVKIMRAADSLGTLTPRGKELYDELKALDKASRGKAGDLTLVGVNEHKGIAARMMSNYPQVFKGKGKHISAHATTSPRVIISMASFCEQIKLQYPAMDIFMEAGDATGKYLNHYTKEYKEYFNNGPWRQVRDSWTNDHPCSKGTVNNLFTDLTIFDGQGEGRKARRFVSDLYSLAKIAAASGIKPFYDVFPEEDLYVLWQTGNMDQYLRKGPAPLSEGLNTAIAKPLLKDIIERAQEIIMHGGNAADLRFGHGEGIMPLAGLMGIEDASKQCNDADQIAQNWQDYRVTTMGANIQWIFFRNKKGEVLVKILLNERESRIPVETDCWPYYRWDDVYNHYTEILK